MKQHALLLIVPVVLVLALGALFLWQTDRGHAPGAPTLATFYCAQGKTIGATFSTGSVALALSDGRSLSLPQTISGSGARYEASTTASDIVFWNEGDTAFITENTATTFANCVAGRMSAANGLQTFTDQSQTFSFSFPSAFSLFGNTDGYTQSWSEQATTTGMLLAEIDIPKSYVPGTNFGDAKFTVGTSADPSAVATCLSYPAGGPVSSSTPVTINGVAYQKVSYGDAGAGNRYDTESYRTIRDNQCWAIEYTIHYSVFENYPPGAVTRFDEAPLTATLDQVAQSFTFLQ